MPIFPYKSLNFINKLKKFRTDNSDFLEWMEKISEVNIIIVFQAIIFMLDFGGYIEFLSYYK